MAYLSWSDATERVAKGLHSYDWELEVVVEAGSAEDVPINIEGKEDGDEWLLEWSFDVSGGAVEFGIEVDEEVALDLTTLRSEMDDGIAEGRVMIDSRAQALLLVFENQRGFWFSSSETKRITGVVKIVRREMGGESAATGGGLMLSSSRGQFPARRRVRKKAKEGGWRKQPRAMRSERRMPRTVGGGGGGVRGGGRRKRRAKKGRPLLSSVSSYTTTTSSCSTSESGSGSSSESSGEEETSVTSAASEGTSGGGTEAGTLVTPEDYTEELEYMEAMLRFKEERHVQKTAPPPRGGVSGRAAQGTAKAKPSKPLRPKPQPPKARGGRPRRREGGRGRSSSRGGGGTEQRGVSGSAKEQALQRHCNELKAQVRDLSKFLASVEDDEEGRAAALERKLLEESAKSSAAEAKCAALEQDLELATTVSAKWRECCDRQRVALREASEEKAEALAAVAARVDKTSVSESERDAALRYDALQEKQHDLRRECTHQSEEIERLRAALAETNPATVDALKLKALHLEEENKRLTAALKQSSPADEGVSESAAVRMLRATVQSHREQLAAAQSAADEARAEAAAARSASSGVESDAPALIDVDSALAIVCQEQEVQIATLELELRRMVSRESRR